MLVGRGLSDAPPPSCGRLLAVRRSATAGTATCACRLAFNRMLRLPAVQRSGMSIWGRSSSGCTAWGDGQRGGLYATTRAGHDASAEPTVAPSASAGTATCTRCTPTSAPSLSTSMTSRHHITASSSPGHARDPGRARAPRYGARAGYSKSRIKPRCLRKVEAPSGRRFHGKRKVAVTQNAASEEVASGRARERVHDASPKRGSRRSRPPCRAGAGRS